jgi:hypothetical protein
MVNIGYKDWPARARFIRTDKEPIESTETSECVKPEFSNIFYIEFQAPNEPGDAMIFF